MKTILSALCLSVALTACGGGGNGDPELTCDASPPATTLEADVQPILTASCQQGCHLANDPYGVYISATESAKSVGKASVFAGQIGTLKAVDANNLANSSLWLKLLGGQSKGRTGPKGENVGSAMPQGKAMLTAAQLATFKAWICTGAK